MAVNVNVIGRLGADCEVRTNSNGKPFVTFRVATDEFKNGKVETAWLNVVDYSEKTYKMSAYLKKGSLISIHGIETVGTYTTKSGEIGISRDIMSDRVDFVNSSSSGNTASVKSEDKQAEDEPNCGTLKKREPIVDVPKVSKDLNNLVYDGDDDLPF